MLAAARLPVVLLTLAAFSPPSADSRRSKAAKSDRSFSPGSGPGSGPGPGPGSGSGPGPGSGSGSGRANPFSPPRLLSPDDLLGLAQIGARPPSEGIRVPPRAGWEGFGGCGTLVLLADQEVEPDARTAEWRQLIVDTAASLGQPPSLVFGFAHAGPTLTAALAQHRASFERGGSQVWLFTPLSEQDAGPVPNPVLEGGDPAPAQPAGQSAGWLGSAASLLGIGKQAGVRGEEISGPALTRLWLAGRLLDAQDMRSVDTLQTVGFNACGAALVGADGAHHVTNAVIATNELQKTLLQQVTPRPLANDFLSLSDCAAFSNTDAPDAQIRQEADQGGGGYQPPSV